MSSLTVRFCAAGAVESGRAQPLTTSGNARLAENAIGVVPLGARREAVGAPPAGSAPAATRPAKNKKKSCSFGQPPRAAPAVPVVARLARSSCRTSMAAPELLRAPLYGRQTSKLRYSAASPFLLLVPTPAGSSSQSGCSRSRGSARLRPATPCRLAPVLAARPLAHVPRERPITPASPCCSRSPRSLGEHWATPGRAASRTSNSPAARLDRAAALRPLTAAASRPSRRGSSALSRRPGRATTDADFSNELLIAGAGRLRGAADPHRRAAHESRLSAALTSSLLADGCAHFGGALTLLRCPAFGAHPSRRAGPSIAMFSRWYQHCRSPKGPRCRSRAFSAVAAAGRLDRLDARAGPLQARSPSTTAHHAGSACPSMRSRGTTSLPHASPNRLRHFGAIIPR